MNSVNPAVLYQNIDTNPTDIILWKLKHASRNSPGAPAEQNMEVWIGKDDESNQPVGTDPKITENLVQYTSDGAIGAEHYEQGILSELSALKLSKIEDWENEPNQWKEAKAVYVVPEGQTKTRFAFTSLSEGTSGNLLDEIYFETLLGNIKIDSESDENNIIITGYWAPIEENDNINIKYYLKDLDNETIEVDGTIDMSALFQSGESGFKASIPKKGLENGNYQLEIWHEHYSEALVEEIFEVDNIPENPETSDNILTYVCLLMISLFGMAFIIKFNKNKD